MYSVTLTWTHVVVLVRVINRCGDWYFPDGGRPPFPGGDGIHEFCGAQRVDIRHTNNANSPSGMYRCDIPTDAVNDAEDNSVRDTVYVGLYATGGNAT